MKTNRFKERQIEEPLKNGGEVVEKEPGFVAKALRNVLGGTFFENEQSFRIIPFLLYVTLLALVYITNSYMIEEKTRKINKLQKEVKEYRYESITLKSKLLTISRQSKLSEKLAKMGIKENTEPVKTIIIDNENEK
jgi:cell division protein FtsL